MLSFGLWREEGLGVVVWVSGVDRPEPGLSTMRWAGMGDAFRACVGRGAVDLAERLLVDI